MTRSLIGYIIYESNFCESEDEIILLDYTPRTEGGIEMTEIKVGKNENLESALRRFKRATQKAGILSELRKREHYDKPSVARKKKSEAARKRKFK